MATDEEIIKELADHMNGLGWSRPKADAQAPVWFEFLAPRIRQQAEDAKKRPALKPGEVPVRELVVGDIVEERHEHWSRRKIVTKVTDKSVVFRTDNGQDGRAALTLKRKGKVVDNVAILVGHYDITPELLDLLGSWYSLGDIMRERWKRGLEKDLPPFYSMFGYAPGEEPDREHKGEEVVETLTLSTGDRVQVVRYNEESTYVEGKQVPLTTWGANVMDPEYDHTFGSLGWRYRDQETARKAVEMFEGARTQGVNLEQATRGVCQLANETLPKADRWTQGQG